MRYSYAGLMCRGALTTYLNRHPWSGLSSHGFLGFRGGRSV